jgi:hypothetical protein
MDAYMAVARSQTHAAKIGLRSSAPAGARPTVGDTTSSQ